MSNEEENDFTYNVIKSAERLIENGNIYTGQIEAAVVIILDCIDHNIFLESILNFDLEENQITRTYKLIHEFYIRWRNSSTGQSA